MSERLFVFVKKNGETTHLGHRTPFFKSLSSAKSFEKTTVPHGGLGHIFETRYRINQKF